VTRCDAKRKKQILQLRRGDSEVRLERRVDMTQPQLTELAGLGLSTVVDFEKERRQVSAAAVETIQSALRRAGVEFIDEKRRRARRKIAEGTP
jgi:hypothetical protein